MLFCFGLLQAKLAESRMHNRQASMRYQWAFFACANAFYAFYNASSEIFELHFAFHDAKIYMYESVPWQG